MSTKRIVQAMVVMTTSTTLAGCVVFPTHLYVPDAADGTLVYERCSLDPGTPAAVRIERPGMHATVSVVERRDGGEVAVRYDLAEHHTLALRQDTIGIDARTGDPPIEATIPHVNPVGPATVETPAVQKLVLPVDASLEGGRIPLGAASSDRHYWIAGRYAGRLADDVWITLPRATLDGTTQALPAFHFARRFVIARGLFNC